MVRDLARFRFGDLLLPWLAHEELLHPRRDLRGLERLAVIPQDQVVRREAGFRAQMAGKLTGIVAFHHDGLPAGPQDLRHLARVEREQVLHVQLIGAHPGLAEQADGVPDDAPGGSPADQSDLGIRRPVQLRRRQLRQHALQLPHALLVHNAAQRRIGVLVADQPALLVMFVGSRHVDAAFRAGQRPGRNT